MSHLISNSEDLKAAVNAKASLRAAAGSSTKTWGYRGKFSDASAIADFLNPSPSQGAGEAMVTGTGPFDLWIYI